MLTISPLLKGNPDRVAAQVGVMMFFEMLLLSKLPVLQKIIGGSDAG
ncbi:hypothetical protein [Bradyrhizobium sp. URHC0002]